MVINSDTPPQMSLHAAWQQLQETAGSRDSDDGA